MNGEGHDVWRIIRLTHAPNLAAAGFSGRVTTLLRGFRPRHHVAWVLCASAYNPRVTDHRNARPLEWASRLLMAATILSSACVAQPPGPASRESKAMHLRLTGVWVAVGTFDDPWGPPPWSNTPWPANPPFTENGRRESARLADIKNVVPCQPGGPIFAMWNLGLFPIEILEAPDRIVIKAENIALPRRIHLDGSHPADLEPSWMGHSVGRWEGDVLVVDTIGTNGRTRGMNGVGSNARTSEDDAFPRLPVSDQLHLVERLRVVANGEVLEDEMTITDPKNYTAPLVVKHYWQRRPDIEVLEYVCGDRPRSEDEVNTTSGGAK
jgi:hypothetical protein